MQANQDQGISPSLTGLLEGQGQEGRRSSVLRDDPQNKRKLRLAVVARKGTG